MIKVFILSYQIVGGFGYAPMTDAAACDRAMAGLEPQITWGAECTEIETFVVGSILAPETAPRPKPKPERGLKDSRSA
jgi:hypothetical protein